jgi:hypothetical protein
MPHRSTRDVLDDHLRLRKEGDLQNDIERNYAPDFVVLSHFGVFHGIDGVRESARLLREQLSDSTYDYRKVLETGEVGFLEWSALADGTAVCDGADSYQVRNGRIVVQTIHYTIHNRS